MTGTDRFAADVAHRCRRVYEVHDGRIPGAWSTREQLVVALVLHDRDHLNAMDFTPDEASRHVLDCMIDPPADMNAWLEGIRAEVGHPVPGRTAVTAGLYPGAPVHRRTGAPAQLDQSVARVDTDVDRFTRQIGVLIATHGKQAAMADFNAWLQTWTARRCECDPHVELIDG